MIQYVVKIYDIKMKDVSSMQWIGVFSIYIW
jgi:hypothetical protein